MRAVLVRDEREKGTSYLIATLHHAIADGLSFVQLQSEILIYCQKIFSGESLNQVAKLPALPSIEELLPEPAKLSQGNKTKTAEVPEVDSLKVENLVPIESRCSGWVYRQLDEPLVQKLQTIATAEKTTVNGALSAALLLTTAKIIRDTNKKIACILAVNCLLICVLS